MNNNLRKRIQQNYYHLTNANKLIADTINSYEGKNFDLKLIQLAEKSYCSNASITKFIKFFGYSSYKVFQHDLNLMEANESESIIESIQLVDKYFAEHKEVIAQLVYHISKAQKIYLFASGQSRISALDFSLKYNKLESKNCIFEANIDTQQLLINTLSPKDLVIFVSNSGESRELLNFIKHIEVDNTYLITNRNESSLSRKIDNIVSLNNNLEPSFNFREFSKESKYTLLYFFDRLFDILYEKSQLK